MEQDTTNPTTASTTKTSTGENVMELPDPDTMDLANVNLEGTAEPVDLDKILENYQSDLQGMFNNIQHTMIMIKIMIII